MKKTVIGVASLFIVLLVTVLARSLYANYAERRAISEAVEIVQDTDRLFALFPEPHVTADVYHLRDPFFYYAGRQDLVTQINSFIDESAGRTPKRVNAIYRGQGSDYHRFWDVSLNVCGSSFCSVTRNDLFEVSEEVGLPLVMAPVFFERDKPNPDGMQSREVYSTSILGEPYQFVARIHRTNSGAIADVTLLRVRPSSSFEAALEKLSGNSGDVSVVRKQVFYHEYALGWSILW